MLTYKCSTKEYVRARTTILVPWIPGNALWCIQVVNDTRSEFPCKSVGSHHGSMMISIDPMEDEWTILSHSILLVDQEKYGLGSEITSGLSPNESFFCSYYSRI